MVDKLENYPEVDRYFIAKNLISLNKVDDLALRKLLRDKNYLIRLLTLQKINLEKQPETLKSLLKDRSQKVRLYAINKIPSDSLNDFTESLKQLVFDDAGTIRAKARELLSETGHQVLAEHYREQFNIKLSCGTVIGLSETGDNSDIPLIATSLKSSTAKVRAAGLYALANLDYDVAKQEGFRLLSLDSGTVKRACASIIPRQASLQDLDRLRALYESGDPETKRYILKIISKYGGWSIAGDFLKGLTDNDPKVRQMAIALLMAWSRYSARLGISLTESDRKYVMSIYRDPVLEKAKLPGNIRSILNQFPFIFSQNEG